MALKLLAADPKYAELFYEWRQDPEMTKYNPLANSTVEALRDRLSKAGSDLSKIEKHESYFWLIEVDDQILGHVSLNNVNQMMLTSEVGYGVTSAARGKGIATSAVRLITERVFAETGFRKLIAYVHEENLSSRKVLEKIGFRQEGILREHYLVNGAPANEIVYGILRREFRAPEGPG